MNDASSKRVLPKPNPRTALRLWARGRLDIGWRDLWYGFWAPTLPGERPKRVWPTKTPHLTLLSVRTAWDALLCVQNWAPGSEIIFSEANIPDMVRLIEAHGLVPVPVPVDPQTLAVEARDVEEALTPQTRAILISPLFGSRMDLKEIGEVARRHKVLLVEDNAQAFVDADFRGSPEADVALFSFGLIKTRTALSGAVVFARDPHLLEALVRKVKTYPRISTAGFYRKLARAMALQFLSAPIPFRAFWMLLERKNIDPDAWIGQMTRGMSGPDLLSDVRRQPHIATLKLLRRRLHHNDKLKLQTRIERGEQSLRTLAVALGRKTENNVFWALPVSVANREELIARARREGFDVSYRASSVASHSRRGTPFSRSIENVVFLPIGNPMPQREWQRLLEVVGDFCCDSDKT